MKNIILCADDYGQNPAISQAIIALAENNRLTATSCMVNSDYWQIHAKWLDPVKQKIDIGLHLNFTEGSPLSQDYVNYYGEKMFSLGKLLLLAGLGKLNKRSIEAEIHAQIDRFIECVGELPAFVDGHQHVHQFPVIRDVFFKVYEARLRKQKSYVRCVYEPRALMHFGRGAYLKRLVIQLSGAKIFKERLEKLAIPHNSSFSGIYAFQAKKKYSEVFPRFLSEVTEGGLIMCHPGLPLLSDPDPIYGARHHEFEYFASDAFARECEAQKIKIAK